MTSALGPSSSSSFTFTKVSGGQFAPQFILDGPSTLTVGLSSGLHLSSSVDSNSLCDSLGPPQWQWTVNSSSFSFPSGADLNPSLYLLGGDLSNGGLSTYTPYLFKLTGSFAGQTISSAASVIVSIAGSNLIASVSGQSGWVPNNKLVTLDVIASDPDSSNTAFLFAWRCVREDSVPCFTSSQQGTQFSNGRWIIDPSSLAADVKHTLSVTIAGVGSDPRTVVAQTQIIPKAVSNGIIPTGVVSLVCAGGNCPSSLNPSKPFALSLVLSDASMAASTLSWFSPTVPTIPTQSGGYSTNSILSVAAGSIPLGTAQVSFSCNITLCINGLCSQGQASLPLTFSLPPSCSSSQW